MLGLITKERIALNSTLHSESGELGAPRAVSVTHERIRTLTWTIALTCGLLVSVVVSTTVGVAYIPLDEVWLITKAHILTPDAIPETKNAVIIWEIRIPRVLLGSLVGAGLSVAGVAVQALLRNVLAEPYLIGISSGASTGAAFVLLGYGAASSLSVNIGAYIGALLAVSLVFGIARAGGTLTAERFIFAGIIIGFAFNALTNLLVFLSSRSHGARSVMFWMLGSLNFAKWDSLLIPLVVFLVTLVLLVLWSRKFDAIAIGDDTAHILGTNPNNFRIYSMALVAACVASLVAVAGSIGFLGLVVPHIARRLVGANHFGVFLTSALLGSILLVWADALARTAFQPKELPIGVLTALIGTPLLLSILRKRYAK
ncbi:FecCD family ABC transporter permease [Mobiluncus mulieris]|uniref:FecCD family ABC transporter permease n=1 Tax=Mobiluncus mulieris TaxID=2052 RepID=UPI00147038DB|nr:iron ABC transporter permease [Mobiluncus mulieris]MCV0009855.1 iron ABC transporter permease [Mobiluncus mulieris]NMX02171.1 iron ABC transporter permease [Mobiluncus mulieris]NMX20655.1 iron ABC transporter permease [Mobiluncus mulieris]